MGEGTPTILIYIGFMLFNKKALKESLPKDTKRLSQVGLWKLQGPHLILSLLKSAEEMPPSVAILLLECKDKVQEPSFCAQLCH